MSKDVAIIGAGVSGLSAAWKLAENGFRINVFEKEDVIGGISSTFSHGECKLDYGPHKIYTQLDDIYAEIKKLLGPDLLEIEKKSRIRLEGKYFDYPVTIFQLIFRMNPSITMGIGISYLYAILNSKVSKVRDDSYESYLINRFGKSLCSLVFFPYAKKIWGEPKTLASSLAESRVPIPSLSELAKRKVMGDHGKREISASTFNYPRNGIIDLSKKMAEKIITSNGNIHLGRGVTRLSVEKGRVISVELSDGASFDADHFISTMPLANLIHMINPMPPQNILNAVDLLKHKNLILVYLVISKDHLFEDNWIFFPEEAYSFNRIFEQKSFSPFMIPKGITVLSAEITCSQESAEWHMDEKKLVDIVIKQLEKSGIISAKDVIDSFTKRIKNAYPVYDINHKKNREIVMEYLDGIMNLYSIGRLGYFNYVGMADCMDMGIKTAQNIVDSSDQADWRKLRKTFESYQTID